MPANTSPMPETAAKRPATTMLDPLPERVPAGESYTVPEDVKADPGDLFAYACAACYGPDILRLTEFFEVSRQTFWIWRKHGKGVPEVYRPQMEKLVRSKSEPFRLPENATLDDMMRPPRGQQVVPAREPAQNHALLDMLNRICASEAFGYGTLKTLIGQMSRPVSNPYVFYRWAWAMGGVPRSYVSAFLTALMQLRIYTLYDFTEGNAVAWEGWAAQALVAPHDIDDDPASSDDAEVEEAAGT